MSRYPFGRSELSGIRVTLNALERAKRAGQRQVEGGMARMAVAILRKSQQYCPVETGSLKRSGNIYVEDRGTTQFTAYVAYGTGQFGIQSHPFPGDRPPYYAVFVHEDTRQNLNYTTPGTGAKFLERAVHESVNELRHVPFDLSFSFQVTADGDRSWGTDPEELRLPPGVPPARGGR